MKSIAGFGLAMLFACSSDLEKIKEIQITEEENYPVETLQNAKLIYSDSSIVRVVLFATQLLKD